MRQSFPGHYPPTPEQFQQLWQQGIFAFDANVLLNFYRYHEETREALFRALQRLKDRIWVPHRAALEYQRSRLKVITDQRATYDTIARDLTDAMNRLQQALRQHKRHFALDVETLLDPIIQAVSRAREAVATAAGAHPDLIPDDPIRERITDLFAGRVGADYTPDQLTEAEKIADKRIADGLPPGIGADQDKQRAEDRRGDVFIWLQMVDHARRTERPLVFISDDSKPDWWLIHDGRTLGPRPELIAEMAQSGVLFYMYSTTRFLEEAKKFLDLAAVVGGDERLNAAIRDVEEVAAWQATTDPLTGLANRRVIKSLIDTISKQGSSSLTGLLLIDIDKFKSVNDTRGHLIGDAVLKHVANILQRRCQRSNCVPARYGGDEFMVFVQGMAQSETLQLAEEIRAEITRAAKVQGPAAVTVSVGVAAPSSAVADPRSLIMAADTAMLRAKEAGGDRVQLANGLSE